MRLPPGLDELRSAMRSIGEEWVPPGPAGETFITCDDPELSSGLVQLAGPSLNIGGATGELELLEFPSNAERDDFFATVETVVGECAASGSATFDRVLLEEHTEAGSQVAATVDVTIAFPAEDEGDAAPPPEQFTTTVIWRTVGDVGLLAIRADSIDVALGFLEDLELS